MYSQGELSQHGPWGRVVVRRYTSLLLALRVSLTACFATVVAGALLEPARAQQTTLSLRLFVIEMRHYGRDEPTFERLVSFVIAWSRGADRVVAIDSTQGFERELVGSGRTPDEQHIRDMLRRLRNNTGNEPNINNTLSTISGHIDRHRAEAERTFDTRCATDPRPCEPWARTLEIVLAAQQYNQSVEFNGLHQFPTPSCLDRRRYVDPTRLTGPRPLSNGLLQVVRFIVATDVVAQNGTDVSPQIADLLTALTTRQGVEYAGTVSVLGQSGSLRPRKPPIVEGPCVLVRVTEGVAVPIPEQPRPPVRTDIAKNDGAQPAPSSSPVAKDSPSPSAAPAGSTAPVAKGSPSPSAAPAGSGAPVAKGSPSPSAAPAGSSPPVAKGSPSPSAAPAAKGSPAAPAPTPGIAAVKSAPPSPGVPPPQEPTRPPPAPSVQTVPAPPAPAPVIPVPPRRPEPLAPANLGTSQPRITYQSVDGGPRTTEPPRPAPPPPAQAGRAAAPVAPPSPSPTPVLAVKWKSPAGTAIELSRTGTLKVGATSVPLAAVQFHPGSESGDSRIRAFRLPPLPSDGRIEVTLAARGACQQPMRLTVEQRTPGVRWRMGSTEYTGNQMAVLNLRCVVPASEAGTTSIGRVRLDPASARAEIWR